jgi:hypothetical protein
MAEKEGEAPDGGIFEAHGGRGAPHTKEDLVSGGPEFCAEVCAEVTCSNDGDPRHLFDRL